MRANADIVVIGAGLSGLYTARLLRELDADVLVVEAHDRVGGRTLTRTIDGARIDLGGQWIGPAQKRINLLASALGKKTFRTWSTGTKLMDLDGKVRSYKGAIPKLGIVDLVRLQLALRRLDRMVSAVDPFDPWATRKGAEWERATLEDWKEKTIGSPRVAAALDVVTRVVFGAEPRDLSLLAVLAYVRSCGALMPLATIDGGAQQDRFEDGAQSLSEAIADELGDRVILRAPVSAVHTKGDRMGVTTKKGEILARRVVCAIPPAELARIDFDPPFPRERKRLVDAHRMGSTTKVVAFYERAFWRDDGLSGEIVTNKGPFSVVFDDTSHDLSRPALVAFVVGDEARAWTKMDEAARRTATIDGLGRFLGVRARAPTRIVDHDWSTEPFCRGCPASTAIGLGWTRQLATLRAPFGRVHFAGTETATEWNGYMEGALESAERVLREIAR
jgi:monoamine oxidase